MGKTYRIETFGCQMNKCDSELMELSMDGAGFIHTDSREADIYIFNTCSVRQHAEDRVIARIRSIRKSVKRKGVLVAVAGCMAQRIGPQLLSGGTAQLAVGTYQSPEIGMIIRSHLDGSAETLHTGQDREQLSPRINPSLARRGDEYPWHRWITISHGCDNRCSYCIVPSVRGPLISFSSRDILHYARLLADEGVTEITLLGQNVNQYGMDSGDLSFAELLEEIARHGSFHRINFLTSHPRDFNADIIRVVSVHENISRSFHLPLQSGSDRILSLMNRGYAMKQYYRIIEEIDRRIPHYSLSTDLIVGFPGESEAEYEETLDAVRSIRFDNAYMYAYSPREGTPAFSHDGAVPREIRIRRLEGLIDLQRTISAGKLSQQFDRTEFVIVEKMSRRSGSEVMGKTFLNHPVILPGHRGDIGQRLLVKILEMKGSTLYGRRLA